MSVRLQLLNADVFFWRSSGSSHRAHILTLRSPLAVNWQPGSCECAAWGGACGCAASRLCSSERTRRSSMCKRCTTASRTSGRAAAPPVLKRPWLASEPADSRAAMLAFSSAPAVAAPSRGDPEPAVVAHTSQHRPLWLFTGSMARTRPPETPAH